MQSDEVLVARFAEPVAQFGMQAQVFERLAVVAVAVLPVERVEARFDVEAPAACQAELRAGIECSHCSPVREVGFDSDGGTFLSGQPSPAPYQEIIRRA